MMTDRFLSFTVREDHVRDGTPGESRSCALAIAIQEATGDTYAEVGGTRVYVEGRAYGVSDPGCDFIDAFDNDRPVSTPRRFRFERLW